MEKCHRCRRPLPAGAPRHIPPYAKVPIAVAMAFMHGGMWAIQILSRPYCSRCRGLIVVLSLLAAAFILVFAAAGVWLWLQIKWR